MYLHLQKFELRCCDLWGRRLAVGQNPTHSIPRDPIRARDGNEKAVKRLKVKEMAND
jgi:hypothetical protein